MAPQVKRGTTQDAKAAAAGKSAKRAKVADNTLQAVVDALEAAADVPAPCRQMLLAMLPGSLAMPADHRSEEQERVVDMVKQVVDGVLAGLEKDLLSKEQAVEEVSAEKVDRAAKLIEAEEAAAGAVTSTASRKTTLVEAEAVLKAASAAHSEAKERQRTGDAPLLLVEAELAMIREAVAGPLCSLCDADKWAADQVTAWCDAVAEALKTCRVADSMMVSVRATCAVSPGERGDFERMVVGQLEKTCTDRIAKLTATLDEAADARAERKAAVDDARGKEEAAEAARKNASEAVLDAEVEESNTAEASRAAKGAAASSSAALETATASRDVARRELERFKSQSVAGFEKLQQQQARTGGGAAAQDAAVNAAGA